ncbi:helix-turn-helix domain-containing protein [Undibacterium sp. SXout20W]|uniref:helix-turn-helix domain-containing protein n=1 Tax=Undibacterium sp. SXout20W TaxID=3413051 RepID=UPI003BF08C96
MEKKQLSLSQQRLDLAAQVGDAFFAETLFDAMDDIVFFVKDLAGHYLVVNQTLVRRCGLREKSALLGRTASDVFPSKLAANYVAQDALVLSGAKELRDQLELHLYPNRSPGWCLTQKFALRDRHQKIIGMTGISRDLASPDQHHPVYEKIAVAVAHLHHHHAQNIKMSDLVTLTGLSLAQLERNFHKIFSITPRQMMVKIRLDAASTMLSQSEQSITDIALACGYQDHSAFSRVFKATVGMTPREYRDMLAAS